MKKGLQDNKGITLVEILVGIAIMGVVATMIAAIMTSGTNYFRKQSSALDLQNEAQLVSTSMTAAVLEGESFVFDENAVVGGKNVALFHTGKKCYVWVKDAAAADRYALYIYDEGADIDFNKGNCLSNYTVFFDVIGNAVEDSSYKYDVTGDIDYFTLSLTFANKEGDLTQSFDVRPRNSGVTFEKK